MSVPPPPPRRRARDVQPSYVSPPPPRVDPDARAARRAQDRQQGASGRTTLIVVAVLAAIALIGAGVIVALSGGDKKKEEAVDTSTTVNLEVGTLGVESVNPYKTTSDQFTPEVRDAVMATLERYVDAATVTVLRKGAADEAELAAVFDEPAITRLAGTDRGVLLDEGLPKATGKVTIDTPPVPLIALSDGTGKIMVVEAPVNFTIEAEANGGVISINRIGILMFTQQIDGTWKITAWLLHVEREGPGVSTTPTTAPTTETTVAE